MTSSDATVKPMNKTEGMKLADELEKLPMSHYRYKVEAFVEITDAKRHQIVAALRRPASPGAEGVALEPFAKAWTAYGDKPADDTRLSDNRGSAWLEGTLITFGDLRRAHDALAALSEGRTIADNEIQSSDGEAGSPAQSPGDNPDPAASRLQQGLATTNTHGTVSEMARGELRDVGNVAKPEIDPDRAPRVDHLLRPSEAHPVATEVGGREEIEKLVLQAMYDKADSDIYGVSHARKLNKARSEKAADAILSLTTPHATPPAGQWQEVQRD